MTFWVGARYGKSFTCQIWCHKRYDILVVEEEDSTFSHSLIFTIFVITFTCELSERRNRCLQLFPQIMSSTEHIWFQTRLQQKLREHKQKTFTRSVRKPRGEKERHKNKKKSTEKFSALQASAVIQILRNKWTKSGQQNTIKNLK